MRKFISVLFVGLTLTTSSVYAMDPPLPGDQGSPEEGTKTQIKQRRKPMPNPRKVTSTSVAEPTTYSLTLKKSVKSNSWRQSVLAICPALPLEELALSAKTLFGFASTECKIEDTVEFSQTFSVAHLTKLVLKSCGADHIPPEIGKLINLTTLNFSCNSFTTVPSEIGNLIHLTDLDLGFNNLTTLPPEIGNLIQLKKLHLGSNELTSLSGRIGKLTNLGFLSFNCNKLTTLPPEIGKLTNLTTLNFHSNHIRSLPYQICNLKRLKDPTSNNEFASGRFLYDRKNTLSGYEGELESWDDARDYYFTIKQLVNFRRLRQTHYGLQQWSHPFILANNILNTIDSFVYRLFDKDTPDFLSLPFLKRYWELSQPHSQPNIYCHIDRFDLLKHYEKHETHQNKILMKDEKTKIYYLKISRFLVG